MLSTRLLSNRVSRRLLLRQPHAIASGLRLDTNDDTTRMHHIRSYHASSKQEILPLVGAALVLIVARYSWKALQRMDDEWDDYQWQLAQYEKQHGPVVKENTKYPAGTLGIDFGTLHLVLCHLSPTSMKKPQVMTTREGARYTFCGVDMNTSETTLLVGQRAYEQYFELPPHGDHAAVESTVQLPHYHQDDSKLHNTMVSTVLQSALEDVLERANLQLDELRPVVTTPPPQQHEDLLDDEKTALVSILGQATTTFVPKPVAAIWGAQQVDLLPQALETPVVVVDVDGHVTTLSLIQKNLLLHSVMIQKLGGEAVVHEIVRLLLEEMPALETDVWMLPRVYQAATSAAMDLQHQSRTHIHIPYCGMDLETKQPLHLDLNVSKSVVELAVQEYVHNVVVPNSTFVLSPHMPPPHDLSGLYTSTLTKLLEQASIQTPMDVSHVLLVGSKQPLFGESLETAWTTLTGGVKKDTLIIPEHRNELVAMGAASLLPNYNYEPSRGLVRQEE